MDFTLSERSTRASQPTRFNSFYNCACTHVIELRGFGVTIEEAGDVVSFIVIGEREFTDRPRQTADA